MESKDFKQIAPIVGEEAQRCIRRECDKCGHKGEPLCDELRAAELKGLFEGIAALEPTRLPPVKIKAVKKAGCKWPVVEYVGFYDMRNHYRCPVCEKVFRGDERISNCCPCCGRKLRFP